MALGISIYSQDFIKCVVKVLRDLLWTKHTHRVSVSERNRQQTCASFEMEQNNMKQFKKHILNK